MKLVLAFICVVLLQLSQSTPVPEDPPCKAIFKDEICDEWDAIDEKVMGEMSEREKRGLSSMLLEKLLKEKIEYLIQHGLLKTIPYVGEFIHKLVENHPEAVTKAISGGIVALTKFILNNINIG